MKEVCENVNEKVCRLRKLKWIELFSENWRILRPKFGQMRLQKVEGRVERTENWMEFKSFELWLNN